MKNPFHLANAALFLLFLPLDCSARAIRIWTQQDLLNTSDVVAIVEPIANENNSDQWEWTPKFAQGVTTTFNVLVFFKGGGPVNKTLRIKHFLYKNGWPPNGGTMISFAVGPLDVDATFTQNGKAAEYHFQNLHPLWLAYLKRVPNGFYVPVTGQIDPDTSFRELHPVSMFDPTHGVIGSG